MILYYALGGGLGHLSRSFALIAHAPPRLRQSIRMLVSSANAEIARPHAPCAMDVVPEWAMVRRELYQTFFHDYIKTYNFRQMVIDTFPFGLLGELKEAVPEIPRVLVGRYLNWDAYRERVGETACAVWPSAVLMVEKQDAVWLDQMSRHAKMIGAENPISLLPTMNVTTAPVQTGCAVVHSGSKEELRLLLELAKRVSREKKIPYPVEVFTPERGLFPVERHLLRFHDVVMGAGYAACASATLLRDSVGFHLHPFERRFDDQARRLRQLQEGAWCNPESGDASTVAALLWREGCSRDD